MEKIMITPEQIKSWIESGLDHCTAVVEGDGHHFEAVVTCAAFADKNRMQRHRMVYQALGHRMQSEIHALSLRTLTPEEAQK